MDNPGVAMRFLSLTLVLSFAGAFVGPSEEAYAADIRPIPVTCPVSEHEFFGLEIRAVNTLKHRDGDFLLRAEGGNQYATWIWTCPYCFFSARQVDFESIDEIDFDPASVEEVWLSEEAREDEGLQLIIPPNVKYRNAAAYYFSIGKPPYFLGTLYLHGSWAMRMSKAPVPEGMLGTWMNSYIKVTAGAENRSEEMELLAVADDLRAKLEAAKEESRRTELKFLLASTLRQAGEHKRAVPILSELASIEEAGEVASAAGLELHMARTEAAFQEEALRYFKEAVKLKETLPEDRLQSIYLIGELSRRLGRYDDARVWFDKAEENPMPQRWARMILKRQKSRLEADKTGD
jgi:tetratricopeptide (TPR) repeat protein